MASPGNRHCAYCIGTLSFPINVSRATGSGRRTAHDAVSGVNKLDGRGT